MSGVAVIVALLKANAPVLSAIGTVEGVTADKRIMGGDLPLGTKLPAISVMDVSSIPRNLIRLNETPRTHVDRVQASVIFRGASIAPAGVSYPSAYASVKALLKLVLAACPSQRGTVNSVAVDAIAPDIGQVGAGDQGTDLESGSRDFIVTWHET